jgi:DNA-binding NtrC family response regulator
VQAPPARAAEPPPTLSVAREPGITPKPTPPEDESLDFKKDQRDRERRKIIAALKACDGNQSKAAEMLQMSRRTLLTKLDLHKLPRPRKRL